MLVLKMSKVRSGQNSIAFFLSHLFHFSLVFIKIHRKPRYIQEALSGFLRKNDFHNQEYLKTGKLPKEMLLVKLIFIKLPAVSGTYPGAPWLPANQQFCMVPLVFLSQR